jgi:hypothetical protein
MKRRPRIITLLSKEAYSWGVKQKREFAQDLDNLIIVSASANRSKSDKTITEWLPQNESYHCDFIESWLFVMDKYTLDVTDEDRTMACN